MNTQAELAFRCACGEVECVGTGAPILTTACYCDDCQEAARQIQSRGAGPAVTDADGGTALCLFRADRFACKSGAALLEPVKLTAASATNRFVARCCNSAMYLGFDKGPYWVSVMRNRIEGTAPPVAFRVMTKYAPPGFAPADNAPLYRRFPPRFLAKMLWHWMKMKIG